MKGLRRLLSRIVALLRKPDGRFDEEIEAHISLLTDENIRAGMGPEEARREALLKFGPVQPIREDCRTEQALPFAETSFRDLRRALRRLRNSPGFAVTALFTLSVGIGATTSIFTLIHAVLLQSLPVPHPQQLFRIGKIPRCCVNGGYIEGGGDYGLVSDELYNYLRDHTNGVEQLAAFDSAGTFLGVMRADSGGAAETYFGEYVSGNYFTMFGIRAIAGRVLSAGDDVSAAPPVAVMSYRAWRDQYSRDPSVIGALFHINGKLFTIVGVAPPDFYGHALTNLPPDFYLPLATEPLVKGESSLLRKTDVAWLNVIGRIRSGSSVAGIEAQMRIELQDWLKAHWSDMSAAERSQLPQQSLNLAPGGAGMTFMKLQYGDWLWILMAAAASVLLIVCINLANLMLVRGLDRRPQTSLSLALGARRTRLVQESLTECLLISLLGGAAGLGVAFLTTHMILRLAFQTTSEVPIAAFPSPPVLAFALALSVLTCVLFGAVPAWLSTHVNPIEALRGANRSTRHSGSRLRKALVVGQVAISVALVSSSGLLLLTLSHLEREDLGFEQDRRTVINIDPLLAGYKPEQLDSLYRRIHDSLAALPGTASVASALYTPQSGDEWDETIYVEGKPAPGPSADSGAGWARVTPEYFAALGNPILKGRAITGQDTGQSRPVAIVNEAFARRFFANQDPIGRHFGKGGLNYAADYEIVGVAKDARFANYNLDKPITAFFYLPEAQSTAYKESMAASTELRSHFLHDVVVEARPGATITNAMLRGAFASVDPRLPIRQIQGMDKQVSSTFDQQRLIARLVSLFGILSLALAAVGLYGVMSYDLARRTSEIGVRIALGANRKSIFALIVRSAMTLAVFGLTLGIPLALIAGRLLNSQLYGVNPHNPVIVTIATIALALAALIAALVPAFRASSISPADAVRAE
jgi:predicted permease